MTTVLEEFVGVLGWKVDSKGPAEFKKQSASIGSGLAKIGALYTAIAGVVTGVIARTNTQTAANYRLAKSMGVSYDWLDRWADGAKAANIGIEQISGAAGYLQRTLGNVEINPSQGKQTIASLRAIGVEFSSIASMSAEDQFDTIATAIGNTDDRATQAAVSAKLFGRSGGIAFARLGELAKSEGKTIGEYINRFKDLEFETAESTAGSFRFSEALNRIKFASEELTTVISAYVGEALAPMMEGLTEWIAANRELVRGKVKEWAQDLARWLKDVYGWIRRLVSALAPVVRLFGGLAGTLKVIVGAYLISKLMTLTKGIDTLSFSMDKAATKAGLLKAGLLAVLAISVSDLMESLADVSNNSMGNVIARGMLNLSDRLQVGLAGILFGAKFSNDADRAKFIAQVQVMGEQMRENIFYAITDGVASAVNWALDALKPIAAFLGLFTYGGSNRKADPNVKTAPGGGTVNPSYNKINPVNESQKKYKAEEARRLQDFKSKEYQKGVPIVVKERKAATSTNSVFNVTVNAPGADGHTIAKHVSKELKKQVKGAIRGGRAAQGEY